MWQGTYNCARSKSTKRPATIRNASAKAWHDVTLASQASSHRLPPSCLSTPIDFLKLELYTHYAYQFPRTFFGKRSPCSPTFLKTMTLPPGLLIYSTADVFTSYSTALT